MERFDDCPEVFVNIFTSFRAVVFLIFDSIKKLSVLKWMKRKQFFDYQIVQSTPELKLDSITN